VLEYSDAPDWSCPSGKLENTYLYLFVLICLYYKKGKKETSHTFFTQFSAGLKSMLTSTLLLKSNEEKYLKYGAKNGKSSKKTFFFFEKNHGKYATR
jgi:hypothetical protein